MTKSMEEIRKECPFPIGEENTMFAQYFSKKSYTAILATDPLGIVNVTFEPDCRNNWHIHHGAGQILLCTAGEGLYQEWGKEPIALKPGDVVNIPAEVKHWHGATPGSWFSHVAIAVPGKGSSCEWLESAAEESN